MASSFRTVAPVARDSIVHAEALQRSIDADHIIIVRPELCCDKDGFPCDKSVLDRACDAASDTLFISVSGRCIDQGIAAFQCPVDLFLRLLVRKAEGPDAKDRHGDAVI